MNTPLTFDAMLDREMAADRCLRELRVKLAERKKSRDGLRRKWREKYNVKESKMPLRPYPEDAQITQRIEYLKEIVRARMVLEMERDNRKAKILMAQLPQF